MLTLGCHLSTHYGYARMAEEAHSINANTLQYFTRNPRGGRQRELDRKDIDAFNAYAAAHGITAPMGYAPYDLEPSQDDMAKQDFAKMVMMEDLARLALMPGSRYLVRPGSAQGTPKDKALANVSTVLGHVAEARTDVPLLIANMPGEGTQVGNTFEELAAIIDGVKASAPIGVCLDTSSAFAMGYDIAGDLDGVLDQFDRAIGLDKLMAVHLNDIKEGEGAHADRHARIGKGKIGFDALAAMTVHPKLAHLPFYLEEPSADLVIYERDITRLRAYADTH